MYGLKTKIGAGATLAALGGLGAVAISSGDGTSASPAAQTQPVQVRTETIRRTIRVVKHEKPKHHRRPKPAAVPAAAPAPRPVAPAPRPAVTAAPPAPVRPATPTRVVSAPAPTRHVTTRSSGSSGSGEHEREHETEHEHEGGDD